MLSDKPLRIGAVVLAAGLSSRMGVQKLLLPWKGKTVIEMVVDTMILSRITEIVVVTGRDAEQIASTLKSKPVQIIYNPDFANGNMVTSLNTGLKALREKVDAILMVLALIRCAFQVIKCIAGIPG
jgi:molybdenum cofactor cytidylyltransferase